MIKEKKPEKIILDLSYIKEVRDILCKISRSGILCILKEDNQSFIEQDMLVENAYLSQQDNFIYITDDGRKASEYKSADKAVLIYLHEGNKDEAFPGNRYFIEGFEDADATYFTRIYQREKKIPWVIGETERLIIREMTPEDTEALYALYEDKSVVEFMEDLPQNSEEEETYIADYIDKMYGFFGFGMWLVELKETGEVIGRVGFQNCETQGNNANESEANGTKYDGADNSSAFGESMQDLVELGFLIAPKYQKQGYAYEACKVAIAYMENEFPEYNIVARCKKENEQAIALCRKLGIHYWLR